MSSPIYLNTVYVDYNTHSLQMNTKYPKAMDAEMYFQFQISVWVSTRFQRVKDPSMNQLAEQ